MPDRPVAQATAPQGPSFEEKWRNRFKDFAGSSDDDAGIAGWSPSGLEARLRAFSRACKHVRPETVWLDAGCGAGTYARWLAAQNLQVWGCDYSFPALVKARSKDSGAINWCASDVNHLPFKAGSFDGALCFGVTQALRDSGRAVMQLSSVVRPGGELWVDGLNAGCLPHVWETLRRRLTGKPIHLRYESPKVLRRLMQCQGLADCTLYWIPILPARWQRYQWLLETSTVIRVLRAAPVLGALLSHAFMIRGVKL